MGLEVYFRRDIANVLRATACASEGSSALALEWMDDPDKVASTLEAEELLQAYRQGVRHALLSVGLAFGLEPVGAGAQTESGAPPSLASLLWVEAPHKS